jgi:hypothetical protein
MRFEIPTMNISMFEVENVITSEPSGVVPESPKSATQNATKIAESIEGVNNNILAFK